MEDDQTTPCYEMIEGCRRCYGDWAELNRQAAKRYDCDGRITYLLIGESPPCHKGKKIASYIYRLDDDKPKLEDWNSNLLPAIMESIKKSNLPLDDIPDIKEDCLYELSKNGIFITDICEYPVNGMPSFIRKKALKDNVEDLKEKLEKLIIENIIIINVGKCSKWSIEAIEQAGLENKIVGILPFPSNKNEKEFIKGLSEIIDHNHKNEYRKRKVNQQKKNGKL